MKKRKIGAGHASAMLRLGLKELRNAMNPARESAADSEIGLYGSMTQGEIADARGGPGAGAEQEGPRLTMAELKEYSQLKAKEAKRVKEHGKESGNERGQSRERDDLER